MTTGPSIFTEAERRFLATERLLGRLATVGRDGTPHIAPVGFRFDPATGVIEVRGRNLEATKKFKDVVRYPRVAIVMDDVLPPWRPRGIEVRGRAEAIREPKPVIRIHPERVVGWGLDDDRLGRVNARDVEARAPEVRKAG